MFDAQVAPAFVKCYYEHYLTNPSRLESMYTQNATFSHADTQPFVPGAGHVSAAGHIKGLDEIRTMLKKLQSRILSATGGPSMKVCFAHLDAVPSGNQTMTVLVGGYFLYPDGASRFVHTFILQATSVRNNYLIMTDVLRIYPKQGAEAAEAKSVTKRPETAAANRTQGTCGSDAAPRGTAPAQRTNPSTAPKEHVAQPSLVPNAQVTRTEPDAVSAPSAAATAGAGAGAAATASATHTKSTAEEPKAKTGLHAHPAPASRSWCDLMDEADDVPPHHPSQNDSRPAKADVAKKPVSSYAAAVRQASTTNVQKPAQKIGGLAALPAPSGGAGDDSETRGNPGAVSRGERNTGRDDAHENKSRARSGFPTGGAHEGKPHEGKSNFIKYCAILKNLPLNCSDEEIIQLLAPHVKVTAVRNGTSQGRTYAFVKFDDEKMVPAIQESGLTLRGVQVDIEKVVEKYAHQRRNNQAGEQAGPVAGATNRYPAREGEVFNNNRKVTPSNTRGGVPQNRVYENNQGAVTAGPNA